jgi:hypothetical protein
MNIALFALALPICVADMSGFVIPNIYNRILFYVALVQLSFHGFGDLQYLLFAALMLTALLFLGTGMGDAKILALIVLTHVLGLIEYFGIVFLLASVHIVVLVGVHRRIPSKIPLAPSIFIGLATYLATR